MPSRTFITQPIITCSFCSDIPVVPVEAACCKRIFCTKCVTNWNGACRCDNPLDRRTCVEVPEIDELSNEVVVQCKFLGCEYQSMYKTIVDHENQCSKRTWNCPFGCNQKITFDQTESHRMCCSKAPIVCVYCESSFPPSTFTNHIANCNQRTFICQCGQSISNATLDDHNKACPESMISCPLSTCDFTCPRKMMGEHMREKGVDHIVELQSQNRACRNRRARRASGRCSVSKIVNRVETCELTKVIKENYDGMTKAHLLKCLFFLLLISVLPMGCCLVRLFVFACLGLKVWKKVMRPAFLRETRGSNVILYCFIFGAFLIFLWKWLILLA